jgi:hypothetical protein
MMQVAGVGAILVATAALAAARPAQAQDASRILKGVVSDSTDRKPVGQVSIYVGRISTGQRTANDGTFQVSAGERSLVLMARRPGYVPALLPVPGGTAGQATDLDTIRLRKVKTDADRAAVQAVDVRVFPELAQFYDHKARFRGGVFLTPDDMEHQHGPIASIVRQKPGFHFICVVDRKDQWDCGQQAGRGPTSIMGGNARSAEQQECDMLVWSNATDLEQPLNEILADQVLALEAYPNPGATPPNYGGSPCAAIMLYMKPQAP